METQNWIELAILAVIFLPLGALIWKIDTANDWLTKKGWL